MLLPKLMLEEIATIPIKTSDTKVGRPSVVANIECWDGFSLSVQASKAHSCTPRDDTGPWYMFEVGAAIIPDLAPYLDFDTGNGGIFTNVPIDVIRKIISDHGGAVNNGYKFSYQKGEGSIHLRLGTVVVNPNKSAFLELQQFLRFTNQFDKDCDGIRCHECSYYINHVKKPSKRALCPFSEITNRYIADVSEGDDIKAMAIELLEVLKDKPRRVGGSSES